MLGCGVYTLREVSRLTRIPPATVRSWLKWRSDGAGLGPVFRGDYESVGGDYAVSFLNLIEVYVAGFFRHHGVNPNTIRRTHEVLQGELGTPHPFARKDLVTSHGRIIRKTADIVGNPVLSDAISKQEWFPKMEIYLKPIEYRDALAARWRIADGVMIDPAIGFGKPIVASTGITTFVLANQYRANRDDGALVAKLFDVSEADVLNAVDFESKLRSRLAA